MESGDQLSLGVSLPCQCPPPPPPPQPLQRKRKWGGRRPIRHFDEAFERLEVIGRGTYGEVYLARDKQTQELVAAKQVLFLCEHDDGVRNCGVHKAYHAVSKNVYS